MLHISVLCMSNWKKSQICDILPWADPGSENGEKVVYFYIVCTGTLFQCNLFESVYFATKWYAITHKEGKSLSKITQWRTQANKNGVSQNATIIFCNNIFLFGYLVMNTYTICVLCNIGYTFNLTILCSSGVSRQRKWGVAREICLTSGDLNIELT